MATRRSRSPKGRNGSATLLQSAKAAAVCWQTDAQTADDAPEGTLEEQYAAALAAEAEEEQAEVSAVPTTAPVGGMAGMGAMGGMMGMGGMMPAMGGMMGLQGMQAVPAMGAMSGMPAMSPMGMGVVGGMPGMPGMAAMNPMGAMGMAPMGAMGSMGGMGMVPMVTMGQMGGMRPMPAMPMSMGAMGGAVDMESMQRMLKEQEDAFVNAMSQTLRAGASAQPGHADAAESSTGSGAVISRSNPMHPAYKPENTEQVLGITDRRFEGHIRMFLDDVGYGFIKSAEFERQWESTNRPKNDVFIHRNQKGPFKIGDKVTFSVYLNFKGKPQGTDLRRIAEEADADD